MWAKLQNKLPATVEPVVREMLWNNSFIKIEQKPLYYTNWIENGIIFIQDLLNPQGRLLSKEEFIQKMAIRLKPLQYEGLLSAIPRQWKKIAG